MSADEFRDYILGFIFYKYLSERMHQYADGILPLSISNLKPRTRGDFCCFQVY